MGSRARVVIVPFCSTVQKLHLEYCIQLWGPQNEENVELSRGSHKDDQRAGVTLLCRNAEGDGMFSLEKALGGFNCGLPELKVSL